MIVNTAELKAAVRTEAARVRRAAGSSGNPLIEEIHLKSVASLSKLYDFLETCPQSVEIVVVKK